VDTAYLKRITRLAVTDPGEFVARLRGQVEMAVDLRREHQTVDPTGDWWLEIHRLLGASVPCDRCADFEDIWRQIHVELEGTPHEVGRGRDAGRALARGAFAATRHLQPPRVVETGVARGVTSRVILEALERNGQGELISVDLPPMDGYHDEWAVAVPRELRSRWRFLRGASRQVLPRVFDQLGRVPLFVHDSLHTTGNMLFEFDLAWRHLEAGGLLLSDDIEDSSAFARFVERDEVTTWIACQEDARSGFVGAVQRPLSS
jgi:hypothetical protein